MEPFETYTHNKLEIEIFQDDSPESSREWDNVGTMICSHRNYNLGDEQFHPDEYEGWKDLEKHLREERNAVIVLPLGLYDHSGITMYVGSNHDRWDGGQVGFIYCTQEDIDKNWDGKDRNEMAEKCLRAEVETYDQYLRGDVWGFRITNPKNDEMVDSCWGFYGLKYVKEEAEGVAEHYQHPAEAAYAPSAGRLHA